MLKKLKTHSSRIQEGSEDSQEVHLLMYWINSQLVWD